MKDNSKTKFIRVNGRVVPIGPKKDGGNRSSPKKSVQKKKYVPNAREKYNSRNELRAKKASFAGGRAEYLSGKSQKMMEGSNTVARFTGVFGAIAGFSAGKGKMAALGAIVGGLLGAKAGKMASSSSRQRSKAEKLGKQAKSYASKSSKLWKTVDFTRDFESHKEFRQGSEGLKKMVNTF